MRPAVPSSPCSFASASFAAQLLPPPTGWHTAPCAFYNLGKRQCVGLSIADAHITPADTDCAQLQHSQLVRDNQHLGKQLSDFG